MVAIGSTADGFADAISRALSGDDPQWRARVDAYLSTLSWDRTWGDMRTLCEDALRRRERTVREDTARRVHLAFADRRSASRPAGPAAPAIGRADV
jgi:hypothetical protein